MAKWVNRTLVQGPRNGTSSHTFTFTAAAAGNLLVLVLDGPVSHTVPTGWSRRAQAFQFTELSVYTKTATAGESSFSVTHNGSNYPVAALVYEFYSGSTWVNAVFATAVSQAAANPALTGLTGTNLLFGAVATISSSSPKPTSCAWSGVAGLVEDVDVVVPFLNSDGYALSVAYVEDSTATSFAPVGQFAGTGLVNKEALTFAVKAVAPPAGNAPPTANAGPDQANVKPWSQVTITATASDPEGTTPTITWAQTGGSPTVVLSGSGASRTFEAPGTIAGTTLTFTATASDGTLSGSDPMAVTVLPVTERAVIGGVEVPMRIMAIVNAATPLITRVGESASNGGSNTGTAITSTLPAGVEAGDLLILEVGTGLDPGTLSDPSGWTRLHRTFDTGTAPAEAGITVWWKIAGASEVGPAVTASTATRWQSLVRAFRGVDPVNPFIAQSAIAESGSNTTVVHNAPTLTNTSSNAWGIYTMVSRQVATPYTATPGAGLVERVDQDTANTGTTNTLFFAADSNGPVATGSVTYSATGSAGSAIAVMWAALLKPAS